MYPHTTSLYAATVVDNTTYCSGDDDILVVEFDEDERGTNAKRLIAPATVLLTFPRFLLSILTTDATGALPKYHIPARFAVMIPPEFQNANKASSSGKQTTSKKAGAASDDALDPFLDQVNEDDFDPFVDFSSG